MSVPRETVAFVMGAITGHALATARRAEAEAKLARAREALRWSKAHIDPISKPGARSRADEAYEETRL